MLRFVSNLPISRRLLVAFVLAAFLPSLMLGVMCFFYVNQLNTHAAVANLTANAQRHANTLTTYLEDGYQQTTALETRVLAGLRVSNPTLPGDINAQISGIDNLKSTFQKNLNDYQTNYDPTSANMEPVYSALNRTDSTDDTSNQEHNTLVEKLPKAWQDYQDAQTAEFISLQGAVDEGNKLRLAKSSFSNELVKTYMDQIASASQNLNTSFQTLRTTWNEILDAANHVNQGANSKNDSQSVILMTVGTIVITLLIVISAGVAVQRSITIPMTELVSLTRRISKGDTNARVKIDSRDEISIVANSMNNMLDNIVHLIQNTQAQRDVLQGQVEKLVSEVSGVGEGDLRVQAEVTADALGVLADSFNYMVEELGSLVVRVKMVAREVEESTTMTSDRMTELVETADRQIKQIASAAVEIERMALTSQQVAGRAQALASSAREARVSAQGGRQAVQQTVEGMGRIHSNVQETSHKVQTLGERSREINNIVEAMSNIAHQTNRLALDAAIQAAMAGENGKGFGAVAADIRRLAERAKEQASNIGRIVRSVRDDIGAVAVSMRDTERETSAGARLAEEAGMSLESIFSVIERQAHEIEVINQMAMQQQQSSTQVVQIMQGVSESTQESSSSTREAAQNMERMARLAEQLLASVEAFKLRESLNYFAPNANISGMQDGDLEGPLTMSGAFRTVTATAQPISSGGIYNSLLPANSGSRFSQFAPALSPQEQSYGQQPFPFQGNNSGPLAFLPQSTTSGQSPFQGNNSGPLAHSPQGTTSGQFLFPSQAHSAGQFPSPQQGTPSGQFPFPSQGHNSGSLSFPQQNTPSGQFPFSSQEHNSGPFSPPPQGNRIDETPQWSSPNDWQTNWQSIDRQ